MGKGLTAQLIYMTSKCHGRRLWCCLCKCYGRCQWCRLCTEAVSCCGGFVVQQDMKHVLRSMCVLVNVFVAQVLYSSRRNVYIFTTPWTIRCAIRYFSFNILRSHPAMYNEGFNIHALEGAIHIARSTSFVASSAICIDKTNIFLTSPAICIVLPIR